MLSVYTLNVHVNCKVCPGINKTWALSGFSRKWSADVQAQSSSIRC